MLRVMQQGERVATSPSSACTPHGSVGDVLAGEEREAVCRLPASAHVLPHPPSSSFIPPSLPRCCGRSPPPPSSVPARPHLSQSERSVGAGHSESTIPERSSCISPELTGELEAQREETRSNPASVCLCGLTRVCARARLWL